MASSSIVVQVGQCGNQVGSAFLQTMREHGDRGGVFRGDVARAVLVDTEPKAVDRAVLAAQRTSRAVAGGTAGAAAGGGGTSSSRGGGGPAPPWRYDRRAVVRARNEGGAANNWAYGYAGYGPATAARAVDAVRREAERCDRLDAFLLVHSAAGGTGSGLGTFLTEELRDRFPAVTVCNALVCPYRAGEVIVQDYNCMFALAHLMDCSDAVLMFENERAGAVCSRQLNLERPTIADLNGVICGQLVAAALPS
ncbi:unnamed protein product, partial [Phaeothamnion confervicola]